MTVADLWASYEGKVLPKDAAEFQLSETRRAFYAGAQGMFRTMMNAVENLSEDDCVKLMDAFFAELQAFGVDVVEGRA